MTKEEFIKGLSPEQQQYFDNIQLDLYSADWCGMCKVVKNNFAKIAPWCKLVIHTGTSENQDEYLDETEKLGIRHLPTMILNDISKNEEINRWHGVITSDVINNYLDNLFSIETTVNG